VPQCNEKIENNLKWIQIMKNKNETVQIKKCFITTCKCAIACLQAAFILCFFMLAKLTTQFLVGSSV